MKSILLIQLILLFLVTENGLAQQKYPTDEFISPMDIPIKLSGTFGELRSNHFHSGIDIKTGEKIGLNIYAIADGYVSRIKIQSGGYGKALYITHPNGFTSVYGHLNKFNEKINAWVRQNQYSSQSYEVDLYPEAGLFQVEQGDIIAYSGNSGRSGGPHLHFEIRTAADQKPVNPLLLGYKVADQSAPVINLLKVYPYGSKSTVNEISKASDYYPLSKNGQYCLNNKTPINAAGKVYFGINTVDLFNGGLNKNGVYQIEVLVDGKPFYKHKLETFAFSETRYINSLIDYGEYKTKIRRVQKTFIQPNNHLSIYDKVSNKGILKITSGKTYPVEIRVYDVFGNFSSLQFEIEGMETREIADRPKNKNSPLFSYKGNNVFKNEWLTLEIPGKALYDTLHFLYNTKPKLKESYSALHQLHTDETPLHKWCTLAIRADSVPGDLHDKAVIVKIEEDDFESVGGEWKNGFITTRIRSFGNYCIVIDTLAPEIKPINISNQKSLLAQQTIKVKIKDELSGIKTYRPTLNGEWILMEYDAKNDLLTYYFDNLLQEGENNFKLEVWDEKENYNVYNAVLKY